RAGVGWLLPGGPTDDAGPGRRDAADRDDTGSRRDFLAVAARFFSWSATRTAYPSCAGAAPTDPPRSAACLQRERLASRPSGCTAQVKGDRCVPLVPCPFVSLCGKSTQSRRLSLRPGLQPSVPKSLRL